jgi:hypothetical protein
MSVYFTIAAALSFGLVSIVPGLLSGASELRLALLAEAVDRRRH